ncbi:hypothetical protein APA_3721 [Pseudanabaena sp. lw0831]|uniref:AAA-like domain-containing protein n=1 Tax=Pseudanabaena sp. lw0831 TaxID=1357935 RepID=UPI0019158FA1|nr:AAA-like domain-containing protein [Pseudanabaena sp. lw0831]GBO55570.1 hypothetical protein APA_3721 [Pseudanabaena sp. lw0831]
MAIKKVLILAANPLDLARIRLDKEVKEIRTTLERSPNRDRFVIESRGAVSPEDLQTYLHNLNPQILHFSGHGGGDLGLAFEDEDGNLKAVSNDALADLSKLFANQIQCVVLNACYAVGLAEAIAQHIPYVIGMNQAIGDKAARKFAEGFYKAIWVDRSIEDAFALGVNAIKVDGIPEELTPVLIKRKPPIPPPTPDPHIVVENNGYFYVVRSQLEQRCYEEVVKAGTLIRIKSPERMGKSLMMGRVLDYATQQEYRTAVIDLQEANKEIFADINKFLQWFCACVGDQLEIEQRTKDAWKGMLGPNTNCTKYVERFFLHSADSPLVIAIDNFDRVFKYSAIEADFCGLLRGWFEKVNTSRVWGKLRQIIVYSEESSTTQNINQSPFNVGLPIDIDELNASEVQALISAYKLSWTVAEVTKLMDMIGGHPYLIQKAIDQIAHQNISLETLLRSAPTEAGIYKDHLVKRLQKLEANPDLVVAMKLVVNSNSPVNLKAQEALKLDSMGLIKRQGQDIVSRCNLYRLYFKNRLS